MDYTSYSDNALAEIERDLATDGYRLLEPGIDYERPTDEYYDSVCGTWQCGSLPCSGGVVRAHWALHRRKLADLTVVGYDTVTPEQLDDLEAALRTQGYQLLRVGDKLQPGDEYYADGFAGWTRYPPELLTARDTVADGCSMVRRKLGTAVLPVAVTQPELEPTRSEGDRLMQFFFGCK